MGREVKLGNKILQGKPVLGDTELRGVTLETLEKFYGPTTSNIIRDLDHVNPLIFHGREEDEIHVDETRQLRMWVQPRRNR
jgi:hypothetical protein